MEDGGEAAAPLRGYIVLADISDTTYIHWFRHLSDWVYLFTDICENTMTHLCGTFMLNNSETTGMIARSCASEVSF